MKKILVLAFSMLFLVSCSDEAKTLVDNVLNSTGVLSQTDIGKGLREALNNGIDNQVSLLTATNGFYTNELVKIALPEELQVVEKTLRTLGLGSLADEGIKALNRTAEDAVKTATPIFVNAVKDITFDDAKNILLGENNAATTYLQTKTKEALYNSFSPVIKKSFSSVGADEIWSNLISKYNAIPLLDDINPDLTDYVTNKALQGVFTMIAVEEKGIREDVGKRTSDLLKKVFKLQDDK